MLRWTQKERHVKASLDLSEDSETLLSAVRIQNSISVQEIVFLGLFASFSSSEKIFCFEYFL